MQAPSVPSPREHPNGYVGLSSSLVTAFVVTEAKRRFNADLTIDEAAVIVAGVTSLVLFLGKKVGNKTTA
jgi:hypothetical protein